MLSKLEYKWSNSKDANIFNVNIRIVGSCVDNNYLKLPTDKSSLTLPTISSLNCISLNTLKSRNFDYPNLSFTKHSNRTWCSGITNSICSGEGLRGRLLIAFFDLGAIPVRIDMKKIKLNLKKPFYNNPHSYVKIPHAGVGLRGVKATWPKSPSNSKYINSTSKTTLKHSHII